MRNHGLTQMYTDLSAWPNVIPAQRESRKSTMDKQFYVYILASKRNGTLYTGVTSNLVQRVWQHKQNIIKGFTKKYNVKKLVYFEVHTNAESAITGEKRIKNGEEPGN